MQIRNYLFFIWKFLLHVCYVEVFCKITILIIRGLYTEIIPRSIGFYCPKGLPLTKNILQDATGEFKSLLDETYHSLLKRKNTIITWKVDAIAVYTSITATSVKRGCIYIIGICWRNCCLYGRTFFSTLGCLNQTLV